MRCSMLLLATFIGLTTSLLNMPARAQGHAGTEEEQHACSRDASRFCRKQLGDDNAVQACLQAHRSKLSSACRKVFESRGM